MSHYNYNHSGTAKRHPRQHPSESSSLYMDSIPNPSINKLDSQYPPVPVSRFSHSSTIGSNSSLTPDSRSSSMSSSTPGLRFPSNTNPNGHIPSTMNNNQNGNGYTGYNNNDNSRNGYNNNLNGYSFSPQNSVSGLPQQNSQYHQQAPPPPPPHHYTQQQQQNPPPLPRLPENYSERNREPFLRAAPVSHSINQNTNSNDSDDSPTAPLSPHLPAQHHNHNNDDQSDMISLESSDISAKLRKSGSLFRRPPQAGGQYSFGNPLSPSSSIKSSSRFAPRTPTGSSHPFSGSPSPTQSTTALSAASTGSSMGMTGLPLNEMTTAAYPPTTTTANTTSIHPGPPLPTPPTHYDLGRTPSGNPNAFRHRLGARSQRVIGGNTSPFQRRHGTKGSIGSRSTMSTESNEQDEMNDTIAPLGMFKAGAKKEKKEVIHRC
ncbi:unnamed protein product [Ambrosiozyma monospora]|uniref:Unnamed protein product n=1 Tax=Ambrosiozyma monospora TaxID=43982 RepID=A0ACB5SU50_AMBMO|nr:unnamed protein product [Ambrosiozyma monospora]